MKYLSPFIFLTGVYLFVGNVVAADPPQSLNIEGAIKLCEELNKDNKDKCLNDFKMAFLKSLGGASCDSAKTELTKAQTAFNTACQKAGLRTGTDCLNDHKFCKEQYDEINENSSAGSLSGVASMTLPAILGASGAPLDPNMFGSSSSDLAKCLPTKDAVKDMKEELKNSKKDLNQLIKDMQTDKDADAKDLANAQKALATLTKEGKKGQLEAQEEATRSQAEFKKQTLEMQAKLADANKAIIEGQLQLARAQADQTSKLAEFSGAAAQDQCTTKVQEEYYTYIDKVNKGERPQKSGIDRGSKAYWIGRYTKCIAEIEKLKTKLSNEFELAIKGVQLEITNRQEKVKELQQALNDMNNLYQQQLVMTENKNSEAARALAQDRMNLLQEMSQKQQLQQQKSTTNQIQIMKANQEYRDASAQMSLYGGSKNLNRAPSEDYSTIMAPYTAWEAARSNAKAMCCDGNNTDKALCGKGYTIDQVPDAAPTK